MGKNFLLTLFLSFLFHSLAAQQGEWRWSVQGQALYQGLSSSYSIALDGPNSSTVADSKAGLFYGLQGGIERVDRSGWVLGAMLGYLQQGVVERQETSSVDNPSDVKRKRWTNHQFALPLYLLRHLGKSKVAYVLLGVMPAFSLGESDRLILSPNASTVVLNANLEVGAEITLNEAALRPGLIIGASLTDATRAGDHAIFAGIQLQYIFEK